MSDYPVRSLLAELETLSHEAEPERLSGARSTRIEQPLERLGRGHFLSLAKALAAVRIECECYGGAAEVDAALSRLWDDMKDMLTPTAPDEPARRPDRVHPAEPRGGSRRVGPLTP